MVYIVRSERGENFSEDKYTLLRLQLEVAIHIETADHSLDSSLAFSPRPRIPLTDGTHRWV